MKHLPVSINGLAPLLPEDLERLHERLSALNYNDDRGFGFREIDADSTTVSATLVKRTPTFIPEFDPYLNQIVRKEIYLFSEIDFSIDANYELLEIFDTLKNASKVRIALRPLLSKNIRLFSINLAPFEVIPKLSKDTQRLDIERLSVRNFKYAKGIVGRFDMKVENTELALDIMKKYSHEVTRASVKLTADGFEETHVRIYDSGHLIISCEEEDFDRKFKGLKNILFAE